MIGVGSHRLDVYPAREIARRAGHRCRPPPASKLEKALRLGADRFVATEELPNPVATVRELTGGHGADIVIEAVGKAGTWNWSVEMLRRGGTVNFFGGPPSGTRVELDTNLLHYSEITCKASFHHTPATMREALDIIASGGIARARFRGCRRAAREPLPCCSAWRKARPLKTAIIP